MAVTFEQLVALAYDAPIVEDGWKPFLHALGERTGSRAVGLKWLAFRPRQFHMVDIGLDSETTREYANRFGGLDAWSRVRLAPDADVFGDDMLPRRAFEATEFYQDFCRRHDIADIHKVILGRTDDVQVSIGLLKSSRRFDRAREHRLTQRLAPHLRRSLALASRLAAAGDTRRALADTLELSASAVFFLDAAAHVRFCTAAAERIVALQDGLVVTRGVLHAQHPDDDRALAVHLAGATAPPAVLVTRPSGHAPYRVLAVPARSRRAVRGIATFVFVTEARTDRSVETILRRTFGLTAAEIRVALHIARGRSPKQVAAELDVSWYTVRAQLRQVFAKTGARRQAMLVELIARLEHG